ncbi:amidohydrolase family protein [Candidatus Bathyarchaeota archaeon]|nr:amidohydrolase family protein [Candidatus Bathyarchaeota archaeon]
MYFDIVIRDGHIIDGTGNPWFKADIGIKNGKIAKLSCVQLKQAERIINVKGLLVCPGFINIHSHSDYTILSHNNAENCLAMGLVTELTGNCGLSVVPITDKYREAVSERMKDRTFNLMEEELNWLTLSDWMKKLEEKHIGINIASLVGHGALRSCVMGLEGEGGERIEPTEEEMDKMKAMLDGAMREGAFGLSTGLSYPPQRNALTEEIIELAKVVANYGGVYASHMRSEGDQLLEATREFIEICKKAGVRGTISHHKASGRNNYGKASETIRMVERARARGIDIIIDQYPWRHGGVYKSLGSQFVARGSFFRMRARGEDHLVKTREELVEKLKDPKEWEKLKVATLERREKEIELYKERKKKLEEKGGWEPTPDLMERGGTIIHSKTHPELEGKSLKEVAVAFGVDDIWEGIRALLIADKGWTCAGGDPLSEDDIITILSYPWTVVSTDGYAMDNSKVSLQVMADALSMKNPRDWGTYAKILRKYVLDEGVLTMEEAVRKMTSLPASFLGLQDRGIVREGFWADLVVFDPDTVKNVATYGEPCLFPKGIPYVLVNGKLAIDEGKHTGALAGKVLRYNI